MRKKYPDAKLFAIAVDLASRGDVDGSFEMLEKAARKQDIDIGAAAVYPTLAVLYDDPRWLVKHLPEHAREAVMFRNGIETYKLPDTVPAIEGQVRVF